MIAPQLRGERPVTVYTLGEFVPIFLERHAIGVRERTISTLRDRLRHPITAFGDQSLAELEHMTDEIAAWQVHLPSRARHGIVQAFRQCLDAAVRWGHMHVNPAKAAGPNPKTPRRTIRPYSRQELDAIAAELAPEYQPLPQLVSATGLRPEEWLVLERGDIDRRNRLLNVRRTLSSGKVVELAKTDRSRRQVPLTRRALARARPDRAAGNNAAAVHSPRGWTDQPRQLPPPRMGAGDRGERRRTTGQDLRHARDLRQ